jgi:hypothetical protein
MVKASDAGTCVMLRGDTREEVELALREREAQGCARNGAPTLVGKAWIATCAKPGLEGRGAEDCQVERLGHQVVVRGPTERAVRDKIAGLITGGAMLLALVPYTDLARGETGWSAYLDAPR